MQNETKKKFFILAVLLIFSIFGARISFVWGSQKYFFSSLAILLPLVGVLFKTKKTFGVVGGYFFLKALFGFFPLTFGLPSLCAAANYSSFAAQTKYAALQKFFLNVVLPLLCMLIFVAHPVGRVAWVYSLYWLIPVFFYFQKKETVWAVSLSSSFIAHAVGSMFWLFLMPMSPERWLLLIPIVAVERLLFAVASVVVYGAIKKVMAISWPLLLSSSFKKRDLSEGVR